MAGSELLGRWAAELGGGLVCDQDTGGLNPNVSRVTSQASIRPYLVIGAVIIRGVRTEKVLELVVTRR